MKEKEFSHKVKRIYEMVQEETVEIYEKALAKIQERKGEKVPVSFEVQKRAKEIYTEMEEEILSLYEDFKDKID